MRRTLFGQGLIGFGLCVAAAQVAAAGPSQAAIASAHPLATAAGQEMLEAGGNAFDAAIAIAAALAVVEPSGSGLGGGGFFLLHDAKDGRKTFLDARETAPGEIRQALYLNEEGKLQQDRLRAGPLAAGIPGLPAGLVHLARTRASLPLPRLLEPAIRHAREGFEVDGPLADRISRRAADLRGFPASQAVFLNAGEPLPAGALLVQADLASTLQKLAAFGFSGFYEGPVAEEMVRSVQAAGGVWSEEDLRQYRVIERRPLILSYGDWQIVSAPPPSSGGLVLGEIFHMLELLDYAQQKDPGLRAHILVEAMRRAYFDRARYMGDPDYVPVPSRELLAREHAEDWLQSYSPGAATPSADLAPEPIASVGMGVDTTHFSVIDTAGNRVAATLSINYPLGAAFVAGRTGVLLNNEMDDFVIQPGVPNGYGLVGGEANFVEPGKRMLSSMTPTIVEKDGELKAVLGTPGGATIITSVFQTLMNIIDFDMSAQQAVDARKSHSQWQPAVVMLEKGTMSLSNMRGLLARGHRLYPWPHFKWSLGRVEAILVGEDGRLEGAADTSRGFDDRAVGN